jgi:hypothetical protein
MNDEATLAYEKVDKIGELNQVPLKSNKAQYKLLPNLSLTKLGSAKLRKNSPMRFGNCRSKDRIVIIKQMNHKPKLEIETKSILPNVSETHIAKTSIKKVKKHVSKLKSTNLQSRSQMNMHNQDTHTDININGISSIKYFLSANQKDTNKTKDSNTNTQPYSRNNYIAHSKTKAAKTL